MLSDLVQCLHVATIFICYASFVLVTVGDLEEVFGILVVVTVCRETEERHDVQKVHGDVKWTSG